MTTSPCPPPKRRRYVGLLTVLLSITLLTGALHGRLTQRWGPVPDLAAAAEHLNSFPREFGDWQLLNMTPMEESTVQMLECAGYVNRQYVNRKTGETVSLAIMLGPSGPIAVHTPEVCYSSRAYSIQEPRKSISLTDSKGQVHSFWSLAFRANTLSADQLRVCYAWCENGLWEASKSPRFQFAGRPLLFKLQIAGLMPTSLSGSTATRRNPCEDFLAAMLHSGWSLRS